MPLQWLLLAKPAACDERSCCSFSRYSDMSAALASNTARRLAAAVPGAAPAPLLLLLLLPAAPAPSAAPAATAAAAAAAPAAASPMPAEEPSAAASSWSPPSSSLCSNLRGECAALQEQCQCACTTMQRSLVCRLVHQAMMQFVWTECKRHTHTHTTGLLLFTCHTGKQQAPSVRQAVQPHSLLSKALLLLSAVKSSAPKTTHTHTHKHT